MSIRGWQQDSKDIQGRLQALLRTGAARKACKVRGTRSYAPHSQSAAIGSMNCSCMKSCFSTGHRKARDLPLAGQQLPIASQGAAKQQASIQGAACQLGYMYRPSGGVACLHGLLPHNVIKLWLLQDAHVCLPPAVHNQLAGYYCHLRTHENVGVLTMQVAFAMIRRHHLCSAKERSVSASCCRRVSQRHSSWAGRTPQRIDTQRNQVSPACLCTPYQEVHGHSAHLGKGPAGLQLLPVPASAAAPAGALQEVVVDEVLHQPHQPREARHLVRLPQGRQHRRARLGKRSLSTKIMTP